MRVVMAMTGHVDGLDDITRNFTRGSCLKSESRERELLWCEVEAASALGDSSLLIGFACLVSPSCSCSLETWGMPHQSRPLVPISQ